MNELLMQASAKFSISQGNGSKESPFVITGVSHGMCIAIEQAIMQEYSALREMPMMLLRQELHEIEDRQIDIMMFAVPGSKPEFFYFDITDCMPAYSSGM